MKHNLKSSQKIKISDKQLVDMILKQMSEHIKENKLYKREKNLIETESILKKIFNLD